MSLPSLVSNSLAQYNKPTVWSYFSKLALDTASMNLGQGFPSWDPPSFFTDQIVKAVQRKGCHQYTRVFGTDLLTNSISQFYAPFINRKLNPLTEILVTAGGVDALCAIFMGTLNPSDEVILIEPFYDCYLPQIKMAGGVARGVPLKKGTAVTKQQFLKGVQSEPWAIDFQGIESKITPKTKYLVINNPHNPTGKVLTADQTRQLEQLLRKYPHLNLLSDEVYEHISYSQRPFQINRIIKNSQFFDRCVSVCSAGKLFSSTGIRVGWAIGPQRIIRPSLTFHQYNIFCMYDPIQTAVANSLQLTQKSQFFEEQRQQYLALRNVLLKHLASCKFNWKFWIPQGGYFILTDISGIQVSPQFMVDQQGVRRSKDFAFCVQLAKQEGVVAIPCSVFYTEENKAEGQNLVRFAFCKGREMMAEAAKRMS